LLCGLTTPTFTVKTPTLSHFKCGCHPSSWPLWRCPCGHTCTSLPQHLAPVAMPMWPYLHFFTPAACPCGDAHVAILALLYPSSLPLWRCPCGHTCTSLPQQLAPVAMPMWPYLHFFTPAAGPCGDAHVAILAFLCPSSLPLWPCPCGQACIPRCPIDRSNAQPTLATVGCPCGHACMQTHNQPCHSRVPHMAMLDGLLAWTAHLEQQCARLYFQATY
jgi:hypothetical protein